MAIVKMKRLRLIGLSEERDALLGQLLSLGCVEVTEPEDKIADPQWTKLLKRDTSTLTEVKGESAALHSALTALRKYAPVKTGLFQKRSNISEEQFWGQAAKDSAMACAETINQCTREIAKIYAKENKLNATITSLTPWASLELPLESGGSARTQWLLGTCPAAVELSALQGDLAAATDLAELVPVSQDKDQQYFLLIVYGTETDTALSALRSHSFSVVHFKDLTGTAGENIDRLRGELSKLQEERKEQEQAIIRQKDRRGDLQVCLDRVEQEISEQTVAERFLTDGTIFFAEGWIPAEKMDALKKTISGFTCAYETAEVQEGDEVPTLLKNPKWMDGINMVTEMYSLPAYDGIDPNPLMFFWYVLFFGFMFADVAYGIIIFLACLVIIKKFNPKNTLGRMFHLGLWLGGATAVCGVFTGGFFGNVLEVIYSSFLPNTAMPGWMESFCNGILISPVQDPMRVLIIAIVMGCFHLLFGQCIHIYMGFRDHKGLDALLDVVPWWIVFVGIGSLALGGPAVILIIGVIALVCTQGRHKDSLGGKIFGGIASLYDITSWLSDVLSYARLMALMLATSVIAQVFNTLGALPRNIIVFVIVFLIGHVFNIGVNLIGTYVHAARLQYLEFFGKFYKEGGIPFRPLQYNTKYVDINNEEE
jgi:V/A-type H+-transporting ATPase subunit I